MEFKVIEETKTRLIFELKGEDHTLLNALKEEIARDDKVKVVTYHVEHPSVDIPQMVIETSDKETPKEALSEAIKRLKKNVAAFKKAAEKEIK